jgi:hypothetical protein
MSEMKGIPYRSAVGSLMYAMVCTRPDLSFSVSLVSRYLENPGKAHWIAVKRILRYIQGTQNMVLKLGGNKDSVLNAYSDSDYAGDLDERRSTTGYVVRYGTSPISWKSRKQPSTSLSSTEAEYIAMTETTQEVIVLMDTLKDMMIEQKDAPILFGDNQGALKIATNPISRGRTKHAQVKFYFLRDMIQKRVIQLKYCRTNEMLADIFTKGIDETKFNKFTSALRLIILDEIPRARESVGMLVSTSMPVDIVHSSRRRNQGPSEDPIT